MSSYSAHSTHSIYSFYLLILKEVFILANYIPYWRSNAFAVKDRAAFDAWIATFDGEIDVETREQDGQTLVALFPSNPSEMGIPLARYNAESQEFEECDFPAELSEHLMPDSVAVLQEVGHEKLRYLVGVALAVNADGEILKVSLDDLYPRIAEEWGLQATPAEY